MAPQLDTAASAYCYHLHDFRCIISLTYKVSAFRIAFVQTYDTGKNMGTNIIAGWYSFQTNIW